MRFLEATLEDFQRPINTDFEDSIHMPQNHHILANLGRVGSGSRKPHVALEPSSGPGTVPMWDDASGAIYEVSSSTWLCGCTCSLGERFEASIPCGSNELRQLHSRSVLRTNSNLEAIPQSCTKHKARDRRLMASVIVPYFRIPEQRAQLTRLPRMPHAVFSDPVSYNREIYSNMEAISLQKVYKRSGTVAPPHSATLDCVRKTRAKAQDRNTTIPDIASSDSGWAKPLHASSKPFPPLLLCPKAIPNPEISTHSASSDTLPSTESFGNEIDSLAEAMKEMHIFQNILSSPPEDRSYKRRSTIPHVIDAIESARVDDASKAMCAVPTLQEKANMSTDSVASVYEELKRITKPTSSEIEYNGTRRRWYTKFCR